MSVQTLIKKSAAKTLSDPSADPAKKAKVQGMLDTMAAAAERNKGGGFFSDIGEGLGDIGKAAGNGIRAAAPVLGAAAGYALAPATGGASAAILGGLSGLKAGSDLKKSGITLGSAAKAGATLGAGQLLSKGAGALVNKIPGGETLSNVGRSIGNAAKSIPGVGAIGSAAKSAGGALKDLIPSGLNADGLGKTIRDGVMGGKPITLGNVADKIGLGPTDAVGGAVRTGVDYAKSHPETLLAAAQGAYGVSRAGAADDARKTALRISSNSWDERQPLRRAGVAGMLNTTRPSLPEFDDPTNPFAQGGSSMATSAPPGIDPALLMRGKKRPLSLRGV